MDSDNAVPVYILNLYYRNTMWIGGVFSTYSLAFITGRNWQHEYNIDNPNEKTEIKIVKLLTDEPTF